MKIREKIWIMENEIVNIRRNFWINIEEIAKERQLEIETKHIIWSKEDEDELIKWNNKLMQKKKLQKEIEKAIKNKIKNNKNSLELDFTIERDGKVLLN